MRRNAQELGGIGVFGARPEGVEPSTSGSEVPACSLSDTGSRGSAGTNVAPHPTEQRPKPSGFRSRIYTRIYTQDTPPPYRGRV